ncbi:MAG: NUDIX domain-containing protein [Candidatus Moranbacteria bacterium]|nr:NUDIX domain-containing protein [Candidatus Moranbacteria bacterium]
MNKPYPQVGVGGIVVRGNRVLLGLRKSKHGQGTWAFPGGHLEFGESPEMCIKREILEETGLMIGDEKNREKGPYTNDIFEEGEKKHYITLFFIIRDTVGEPLVKEKEKCEKWEWFLWEEMPENLFLPIVNLKKSGYTPFI